MSTTPNEPRNPQSGVPGQEGHTGPAQPGQPGQPTPYGQAPADGRPASQQYGQAGGKYGTAEYNPGQYTGAVERPSTIDRLLKLTLISLGVYLLSGILGVVAASGVNYVQYFKDRGMSADMAQDAADSATRFGGPATSIIALAIGLGLYLLVYSGLKKGKNWARILGTVLAAIAIASGLYGLFNTGIYGAPWNIILIVLGVVKIVVDILWIVTAYKAPTTAWFKQHQVQR